MSDVRRETPGHALLRNWRTCRRLPFGAAIFSGALSSRVPYSGSISPRVLELSPGRARIALRDRRSLRNHLGSIHAVALVNLGELASGLAMTTALPAGWRAIVTGIGTEFSKKARGMIVATSDVALPALADELEFEIRAELRDAAHDVVAVTTVRWRVGRA